jgi:hypothetical protein
MKPVIPSEAEESLESKYCLRTALKNNQRCFASLNMTVALKTNNPLV